MNVQHLVSSLPSLLDRNAFSAKQQGLSTAVTRPGFESI